ncbi:MAG: ABC transporter substrate-binding protein [Cellulosilyticaceae bacterium]
MNKKIKAICLMAIIGMSFSAAGCSRQETISFFNYGANIDDVTLKEFEKETGIRVKMGTFDEMDSMYQKIARGGAKYDVILVSDALLPKMIEEGLLRPINHENIESIKQMDDMYMDLSIDPKNKYSVPYMFGTVGIVYDTNVVKEEVDSWDIMWDEKYKGQVFMFDTYRDTIGAALKKLGYSLNSDDALELEEAKLVLMKQREAVNPIYGVDTGTSMIERGETAINMIWSGEGLNLQDDNENLKYVVPKEGANFWIDSLCIPEDATNVSGAEKFINFVSSKESALRIADEIGYTTPNKEAQKEQSEEVRNNPNAYMSEELMNTSELYIDLDTETRKIYDYIWTEVKVKK